MTSGRLTCSPRLSGSKTTLSLTKPLFTFLQETVRSSRMPKLVKAKVNANNKTRKQKEKELAERLKKKKAIVHSQVRAEVHAQGSKFGPIDADKAKKMLGWEVQPDGTDWGEDYFLIDMLGNKVRL